MSIKTSARKHRLLIGNQDFSAGLIEVSNWNTTSLDQSGLVRITANIQLAEVKGLPSSLDDRLNSLWRVGLPVTIEVTNKSGVLQIHPCGRLRILSATYDYEARSLSIQCGDLITLLSYRQPTNPKSTGIEPGILTARNTVVYNLLRAAGINAITNPYQLPYPLHFPEVNGSYLEAVGKLLYSAGFVGWINRNEAFQIKPVSLSGSATTTIQIGGDEGGETYYRRLSSPEAPREIIKVQGVARRATIPQYPNSTKTTRYGAANTISTEYGNDTVITQYQTIDTDFDKTLKILTIITKTYTPIGLNFPDDEGYKLPLIQSEEIEEKKYYESSRSGILPDSSEGKLIRIQSNIYRIEGVIWAEFYKFKEEENITFPGNRNLALAETITINYIYDTLNRPKTITTIKYETEGALLTGINHDWSSYPFSPRSLLLSETNTESWTNEYVNSWTHTVDNYKVLARLKPELIDEDTTTNQKISLLADPQASFKETSNSGHTTPPAPEHHSPDAAFEDVQVCGEARFSQYGGNPYQERERTFGVDYLEGKYKEPEIQGVKVPMLNGSGIQSDCTDEQCRRIAQIEGALLYGRFKGQELGCDLKDEFFNWQPLMRINCREPDGTVRAFCIDDAHFYLGQSQALCNFGAIWVGNASGINRSVTVTTTAIAHPGEETIEITPSSGYIPPNTVLTIGGMTVVTTLATNIGDTVLSVRAIAATINNNIVGTYIEEILKEPFVQVVSAMVAGVGRSDVVARPYALTTVSLALDVVGEGRADTSYISTGIGWDAMTEEQWNNMSTENWNSIT